MSRPSRDADGTAREQGTTRKDLGVNPIRRRAPGGEVRGEVADEGRRTAEVEFRLARNAQRTKTVDPRSTARAEVHTETIAV